MNLLGFARARLADIKADPSSFIPSTHTINEKNVDRLLRIFKTTRCNRDDVLNSVPVLIEESDLPLFHGALANTSDAAIKAPLLYKGPLRCQHGKHRIEAARRYYAESPRDDGWWLVVVYTRSGISKDDLWRLQVGDENTEVWSNGEMFRYMRLCSLSGDSKRSSDWQARLRGPQVTRTIKRLLKEKRHSHLLKSLDRLLQIKGLWLDFTVGSLNFVMDIRSPEAITNYLNGVFETWTHIADGLDVDHHTVRGLESLLPYRTEDAERIDKLELKGIVFSRTDPESRKKAFAKIREHQCMVLSLSTFLKDVRWLNPALKVLKVYLPPKFGPSVARAYFEIYAPTSSIKVFGTDPSWLSIEALSTQEAEDLSFAQLVALAWTHFPFLTNTTPRRMLRSDALQDEDCSYEEILIHARLLGFDIAPEKESRAREKIEANLRNRLNCHCSLWKRVSDIEPKERNGVPTTSVFAMSRSSFRLGRIFGDDGGRSELAFEVSKNIFRAFFPLDFLPGALERASRRQDNANIALNGSETLDSNADTEMSDGGSGDREARDGGPPRTYSLFGRHPLSEERTPPQSTVQVASAKRRLSISVDDSRRLRSYRNTTSAVSPSIYSNTSMRSAIFDAYADIIRHGPWYQHQLTTTINFSGADEAAAIFEKVDTFRQRKGLHLLTSRDLLGNSIIAEPESDIIGIIKTHHTQQYIQHVRTKYPRALLLSYARGGLCAQDETDNPLLVITSDNKAERWNEYLQMIFNRAGDTVEEL